MKILTWNINGIRASKVPLKQLFDTLAADIICLQETKVTRDMLDERTAIIDGYSSYYSFSNARTGYSGVATYVKDACTPIKAEQGLSGCLSAEDATSVGCYGDHTDFTKEELELLDKEGRSVITQHTVADDAGKERLLTIINVYCPRADPEREDRKTFKLRFYTLLQNRAEALLNSGSNVIILGDINMAHTRIDRCDPCEPAEFAKNPGRIWLDQLLCLPNHADSTSMVGGVNVDKASSDNKDYVKHRKEDVHKANTDREGPQYAGGLFVDTFRHFHPGQTEMYTCWNTMIGARETNFGSRIDYILADMPLALKHFTSCEILADVMGSDHCPVVAVLSCRVRGARKCPQLCTRYFPEFVGVQTKLSAFFTKGLKRPFDVTTETLTDGALQLETKKSSQSEGITNSSDTSLAAHKSESFPPVGKQLKLNKPTNMGKKQHSLMSFFNSSNKKVNPGKSNPGRDTQTTTALKDKCVEKTVVDGVACFTKESSTTDAWRNLLKGPPPAPLCKGHGEACLLRTVKKEDSLNKGRQFYVCPRPQGLKTNPQARCEHFEWVEKKRKPKR